MPAPTVTRIKLTFRGQIREIWTHIRPAVLADGPAGTGKTFAICHFIHQLCLEKPGVRVLILRKTLVSLTDTALTTLREEVIHPSHPVRWYGGSKAQPASFIYNNGSRIIVGGMDNPTKFLSGQYDVIYLCEAVEFTEEQVDTLRSRLRGSVLNHPRLVMDTNPSYISHWLNTACDDGRIHRLRTYLRDNPVYYDEEGNLTPKGSAYLNDQLESMSGSRRKRLLDGEWVGVENAIYPHFDRATHVLPLEPNLVWIDGAVGVDYGRRHACGTTPVTVDQYGRRWVHEVWGEPADDHGRQLVSQVQRQMHSHKIRRGMTDPLQDVLAGNLNIDIADGSPGSRIHRTDLVGRLLNIYPAGSSVLGLDEQSHPFRRKLEPLPYDSPGIIFVKGGQGIEALCNQMEAYHEVAVSSASREDWQVARVNDDFVASVEYATQCLEEPPRRWAPLSSNTSISKPVIIGASESYKPAARNWGELFGKRKKKDDSVTLGGRT